MSPELWLRCEAIFERAVALAPRDRATFLERECPDDEVRREVERLLKADEEIGGILDEGSGSESREETELLPQERLQVGAVLAERFEILRFIAAGGMGEVYEAHDREIDERVAIKTIRRQVLEDRGARQRFRREVQIARRVTHPAVCRTFDLFRHPTSGGGDETLFFLSMELLLGESLKDRLARIGRLDPGQIVEIAREVAAGLGAAHDVGVIHRDLKPANVVLVDSDEDATEAGLRGPSAGSGSRSKAPRCVITDFGIARWESVRGDDLTRSDMMVGTPSSIAPEQVVGEAVTPAADVFSFGVLLYEMATGVRPFDAETPLATIYRRLDQPAKKPSELRSDLPRPWDDVILRCLERRPEARFSDPRNVVRALQDGLVTGPGPRRGTPILGLVAAGLLVLGLAGWWLLPRSGDTGRADGFEEEVRLSSSASQEAIGAPAPSVSEGRKVVAVLGFRNLALDEELDWLSTALSEMLAMEMASRSDLLRIVSGADIAAARRSLGIEASGPLDDVSREELRLALGTDVLVEGSFLADRAPEQRIRIDVWVEDRGASEDSEAEGFIAEGSRKELLDLMRDTGSKLRAALGVDAQGPVQGGLPRSPEALRWYAEGVELHRAGKAPRAIAPLHRAVALEDDSPVLWLALGEAELSAGYWDKAAQAATRAFEYSEGLPDSFVLEIRAFEACVKRDWETSEELYHQLHLLAPRSRLPVQRWVQSMVRDGRPDDAMTALDSLDDLDWLARDPAILGMRADALMALGQREESLTAAERSLELAVEGGYALDEIFALRRIGWALLRMARYDEVLAYAERAKRLSYDLDYPTGVAGSLNLESAGLRRTGDPLGAMRAQEDALEIYRRTGSQINEERALANLALDWSHLGLFVKALQAYEEVIGRSRASGDSRLEGRLVNLAALEIRQGWLAAASRRLDEAADLRAGRAEGPRVLGDEERVLLALLNGRLDEASTLIARGLERARKIKAPESEAEFLRLRVRIATERMQDDVRDRALAELRALDKGNSATISAAVRLLEAEEALREGLSGAANLRMEETLRAARHWAHVDFTSKVVRVQARGLWSSGRPEEALVVLEAEVEGERVDGRARLLARLLRTEILFDLRRLDRAEAELARLVSQPMEALVDVLERERLEARLLAAQGSPVAARELLRGQANRAEGLGLKLRAFDLWADLAVLEAEAGMEGAGMRLLELIRQAEAAGERMRSRRLRAESNLG